MDNKLERVSSFFGKHMRFTVFMLFLISLATNLSLISYNNILRFDVYTYILKSFEILAGNFVPVKVQSVGWSLFLAPIYYFFQGESLLYNMNVAKVVSATLGALAIFPVYQITKKLKLNKTIQMVAIFLVMFSSSLVLYSTLAMTEPLFIFFFLLSISYIISSKDKKYHTFLAFIFGGFVYYTRINGIFILGILIVSFLLLHFKHLKKNLKYLVVGILLFWIVCTPFLYTRAQAFGSPFTYGAVDKHFVDDYHTEFYADNVETPSFFTYITSNSIIEIVDKFFVKGFLHAIFDSFHSPDIFKYSMVISPLLILFFLYGFVKKIPDKKFFPIYASFFIFLFGLAFHYEIGGRQRHFFPLIPFIAIFSAIALYDLVKDHKHRTLLISSFVMVFILFSLITPMGVKYFCETDSVPAEREIPYRAFCTTSIPDWAVAVSEVEGKIATIESEDLIMMNLPDTVVGGMSAFAYNAPESGLSLIKVVPFEDIPSSMEYYKAKGVTHILIDDYYLYRWPYLESITDYENWFTEVYSNYESSERRKMKLYEINWRRYNNEIEHGL